MKIDKGGLNNFLETPAKQAFVAHFYVLRCSKS